MGFHPLSPQNWNRMFTVWIEDIQIQFTPVTRMAMDGGILRRIRNATRISAAAVILLFSLHCTKPAVTTQKPARPLEGQPDREDQGYVELGEASWYGSEMDGFEGKPTASGELMDSNLLTCAHKTLPLGSYLEVHNLDNNRRVILRINDRGPFIRGRIVDVSRQAAKELGFLERGKANVRIRSVEKDGRPALMSPVDLSNPLTVQVAALSDPANVQRLTQELEAAIGPVSVQNVMTADGRAIKRIRVGSYTSLGEAQQAAELVIKRFGARGVDPFITRRY